MYQNYCNNHRYSSFIVLKEEEKEHYDTGNLVRVTWEKHSIKDLRLTNSMIYLTKKKKIDIVYPFEGC